MIVSAQVMKTRSFDSFARDTSELDELLDYRESCVRKEKAEAAAKAAGTPQKDGSPTSASKRKSSSDHRTAKDAAPKRVGSCKAPKLV